MSRFSKEMWIKKIQEFLEPFWQLRFHNSTRGVARIFSQKYIAIELKT